MNETNPTELDKAIAIYRERFPEDDNLDMFILDEIIAELRGEKVV